MNTLIAKTGTRASGWRKSNGAPVRIAVSALLVSLGATLIIAGSIQFTAISGAYSAGDVLRTETPETFLAWLATLAREPRTLDGVAGSGNFSRRVADRLLVTSRPLRRRLVISMARADFWVEISPDVSTQRRAKEAALDGTLLALYAEPGAGDLYFCAAWLETALYGFTERPRRLLAASHVFSPRELDIAVERLIMSPLIWSFLNAGERAEVARDLNYVTEAQPNAAAQIIKELKEQGVSFD